MQTPQKITFEGASGHKLAARLDMPDGEIRAYALFAHCFTCSKDTFAASRIARGLADAGIAVLRFDFTGLGGSEGEFANSNFSSNIGDLIAAADYLRTNHEAPKLLIGHSLGGAAVLAAAPELPEVRAVATIGAPAHAEHVVHNFCSDIDAIESDGQADVQLAGRRFTIQKQFLDDLKAQDVPARIGGMRKALMVFHAPLDTVVGIDNAAEIFIAAKHPKSFVSLDRADHLLSRKEDAAYVATVLSAWASGYIDDVDLVDGVNIELPEEGVVRVSETGRGKFQQNVVVGDHRLLADEPRSFGGLDSGPSPYDYLSTALGACTTMTLRMYADHKKLNLEHVSVDVTHGKVHFDDCVDCGEGRSGKIDRFERRLDIKGALSVAELQRLKEIADKCPVHKTLENSSVVVTKLKGEA